MWGGAVAAVLRETSSEGEGLFCLPLFDTDSRGFRNPTVLPPGLKQGRFEGFLLLFWLLPKPPSHSTKYPITLTRMDRKCHRCFLILCVPSYWSEQKSRLPLLQTIC